MIYFIPLSVILILYLFFLWPGRVPKYKKEDRFKKTRFDNTWWMLFSLLGTNLTISGGIVASISGAKFYGIWFLLAPLSAACGLFIFALCHAKLTNNFENNGLYLSDLAKNKASPVLMGFSAGAIIIGTFLAGWEIHIASQAIVSFYKEIDLISSNVFIVSLIIAIMAGIYITKGGWDRAVSTDIIQTFTVLGFVIILGYMLINQRPSVMSGTTPPLGVEPFAICLFGIALFVNNIGFSLVNANNWQIAQSLERKSGRVFFAGGILLFLFSACIYYLANYIPGNNPFFIFSSTNIQTALLIAVVPSFVWSTVDTSSVALSNLIDDIISKYLEDEGDDQEIRDFTRANYPMIFLTCAVIISFLLNVLHPNIFHALLAVTSSLIVYVPAIIAPSFGIKPSYMESKHCGVAMFSLFLVVIIASLIVTIMGSGEWLFLLSLIGASIAIFVLIVYNKESLKNDSV